MQGIIQVLLCFCIINFTNYGDIIPNINKIKTKNLRNKGKSRNFASEKEGVVSGEEQVNVRSWVR